MVVGTWDDMLLNDILVKRNDKHATGGRFAGLIYRRAYSRIINPSASRMTNTA